MWKKNLSQTGRCVDLIIMEWLKYNKKIINYSTYRHHNNEHFNLYTQVYFFCFMCDLSSTYEFKCFLTKPIKFNFIHKSHKIYEKLKHFLFIFLSRWANFSLRHNNFYTIVRWHYFECQNKPGKCEHKLLHNSKHGKKEIFEIL